MLAELAGFLVEFGFGLTVHLNGLRYWMRGGSGPGRATLLEMAGLAAAGGVAAWFDGRIGAAMLAGLLGGILTGNIWAIRAARRNRDRVDEAEAALERHEAAPAGEVSHVPVDRDRESGQAAPVGQALRETVSLERHRALAWLIEVSATTTASLVRDAPEAVMSTHPPCEEVGRQSLSGSTAATRRPTTSCAIKEAWSCTRHGSTQDHERRPSPGGSVLRGG